ncbi:Paraspeckle component 1 [Halotydeus destructor]|nr:Paraspeckle component 1 [Halotydeus destructor]
MSAAIVEKMDTSSAATKGSPLDPNAPKGNANNQNRRNNNRRKNGGGAGGSGGNNNNQNNRNNQPNRQGQQQHQGQQHQPGAGGDPNGNRMQNQHHRNNPMDGNRNDAHSWKHNMPMLGAPTLDLPEKPKDLVKKFTGRCRLFAANLPNSITEDALKELFGQYGEVSEVFLGKSNSFAFVKMDTRNNAEQARSALDFSTYENRTLRVRLAAHAAAIRVKNLTPMVTNDLLEYAFSHFGEVERAVVIADDRGRSIGEGIVEFARKGTALNALKRCQQDSFLLTAIPQPVVVEPFEQKDEDEGFADKHINKHQTPEFKIEREVGPRFAEPGTFEFEFSMRWKQLGDIEKQKRDRLDIEIQEARSKLMEQMEYAKAEHQTKVLKDKLREMEERTGQYNQLRSSRLEDERRREEERQREEMYLRQREEELLRRNEMHDFGSIRRQENDLRLQASALQELLDRQENTLRQFDGPVAGGDRYGNGNQFDQGYPGAAAGLGVSSGMPAQGSPMAYGAPPPNPAWVQGPPPHGGAPLGFGGPPVPPQQYNRAPPPFSGPQKRRRF